MSPISQGPCLPHSPPYPWHLEPFLSQHRLLKKYLITTSESPVTSSRLGLVQHTDTSWGHQRPVSTPQTTGLRPGSRCGRQGPSVLRRSPEAPPPPASSSEGRPPPSRPPTPQSPREDSTLLPFLASPPGQASLAISPSTRQGQRMLCHPTYFSRCCETTVCLENTLSNLGKGACGSDDVAVFGPGPGGPLPTHPVTALPA